MPHRPQVSDSQQTRITCLQAETEQAKRELARQVLSTDYRYLASYVTPMALYSQQEADQVKSAISKGDPRYRRVIFATNIAETSLTIDGVTVVVDSGYVKEPWYDHKKHMTILQVSACFIFLFSIDHF